MIFVLKVAKKKQQLMFDPKSEYMPEHNNVSIELHPQPVIGEDSGGLTVDQKGPGPQKVEDHCHRHRTCFCKISLVLGDLIWTSVWLQKPNKPPFNIPR